MKKYLLTHRNILGGEQWIYRFENDYGASVIKHQYSRGLELAVIKFYGDSEFEWDLCYDTKLTDDTIGYLDEKHVKKLLRKIQKLKNN